MSFTTRYFLPFRSKIIISDIPKKGEQLQDVFLTYQCLDCKEHFEHPQMFLFHQREWHGWRCLWTRIKES